MIKRIYIDNYKCLVNFEWKPDDVSLIMGSNGSGKSTLYEALRDIQFFVNGKSPVGIFAGSTLTRWQKVDVQTFELDIMGNGGMYTYKLEIQHQDTAVKQRVLKETVLYDGKTLYDSHLADVQLFRDDFSAGAAFSKDWTQSGLPFLGNRDDNTRVTWLKEWFQNRLLFVRLTPQIMQPTGSDIDKDLDIYGRNFVGWYRGHIATDMSSTIQLYEALKETMNGFEGLQLEPFGEAYRLYIKRSVTVNSDAKPTYLTFDFSDMSDGERCLVALYALLHVLGRAGTTVCFDEPDNYLALSEVQPWVMELEQAVRDAGSQALIISHHPEIMNLIAELNGYVFARSNGAQVRVSRFERTGGLLPSDIVARGDID